MNKAEREYAGILEGLQRKGVVAKWGFESVKVRLADRTWYTPDFYVVDGLGRIQFHEVKGTSKGKPYFRDDGGRVKLRVAAELYPEFVWKLCYRVRGTWRVEEIDS